MGCNLLTPSLLFPVVERLETSRAPKPVISADDPVGFAEQLGVKPDVGTMFYVGTGRQLANQFGEILKQIESHLLVYEDYGLWRHQAKMLQTVVNNFLRPFSRCPAVVWGHVLTWTDLLVTRYHDGQLRHQATPHYQPFDIRYPVTLRFHDTPPREIEIAPGLLNHFCVSPPGTKLSDTTLMKICHDMSIERENQLLSAPCTEQLGLVTDGTIDSPLLARGLHPARAARIHSVWHDSQTDRYILAGSNPPPRELGDAKSAKCLDTAGVLDSYTLKINRMFSESLLPGESMVTFDELSFAFERGEGRIVTVSASSDVLAAAYLGEPFEESGLGQWLTSHL